MKNKSYVFFVVVMMCCSIILSTDTNVFAKEQKPKLSSVKVVLNVGMQKKLKLKNVPKNSKVNWKSSNNKIVKISQKGILSAKNEGKAVIKVTIKKNQKKYVLKCRVTVKKDVKEVDTKSTNPLTISLPLYGKKNSLFDQITPNKVTQISYWINDNRYIVKDQNKITAVLGYMSLLEVTPIENPMVAGGFLLDFYMPTSQNSHISLGLLKDKFSLDGKFYKIENSDIDITTVIKLILSV